MATCALCSIQETELYENNVPICLQCSNQRDAKLHEPQDIRSLLTREVSRIRTSGFSAGLPPRDRCDTCYSLLKAWNTAVIDYARMVGKLTNADWQNHSRLYDEAADALELATGAAELYRLHREEHEIADRLNGSK